MQAGSADCYIRSGGGRTRSHHHVCTFWYSTLTLILVWHSDPPGQVGYIFVLRLPRFLIKLCASAWSHCHILRDEVYASLVGGWSAKSVQGLYRDKYPSIVRGGSSWQKEELDSVLTAPSALLAIRHGDGWRTWTTCRIRSCSTLSVPCSQP
jgi:hypothetical protein